MNKNKIKLYEVLYTTAYHSFYFIFFLAKRQAYTFRLSDSSTEKKKVSVYALSSSVERIIKINKPSHFRIWSLIIGRSQLENSFRTNSDYKQRQKKNQILKETNGFFIDDNGGRVPLILLLYATVHRNSI